MFLLYNLYCLFSCYYSFLSCLCVLLYVCFLPLFVPSSRYSSHLLFFFRFTIVCGFIVLCAFCPLFSCFVVLTFIVFLCFFFSHLDFLRFLLLFMFMLCFSLVLFSALSSKGFFCYRICYCLAYSSSYNIYHILCFLSLLILFVCYCLRS